MVKQKRVAFYVRVSKDDQTVDNQLKELRLLAELEGWDMANVAIFQDDGISGSVGRDGRPGFNELLYRAGRGHFDIVAAWTIDRLGREPKDLFELTALATKRGFSIFLHKDRIDTDTASGELFFTVMAGLAKFERRRLQERVNAGLDRARAEGKVFGRPKIPDERVRAILRARQEGQGIRKIAASLKTGVGTVLRVLEEAGIETSRRATG